MRSLGKKADGLRLDRMMASPRWSGSGFRNLHPVAHGLRDPNAPRPTLSDFLCGGERRVPLGPLPSVDPAEAWSPQARLRPARHLARPLDGADRDRRRARADRSGLGPARVADRGSPARSASSRCPSRCARLPPLDGCSSRTTTTTTSTTRPSASSRSCDVPFVTSLGVGAHLEALGVPPERITELDWWESLHAAATPT